MWGNSAQTKFDGIWDVEIYHDGPNCARHMKEGRSIPIDSTQPDFPLIVATGEIGGNYLLPTYQKPIFLSGKLNETAGEGRWDNVNTGCSGPWIATKRPRENPSKMDKTSFMFDLVSKGLNIVKGFRDIFVSVHIVFVLALSLLLAGPAWGQYVPYGTQPTQPTQPTSPYATSPYATSPYAWSNNPRNPNSMSSPYNPKSPVSPLNPNSPFHSYDYRDNPYNPNAPLNPYNPNGLYNPYRNR